VVGTAVDEDNSSLCYRSICCYRPICALVLTALGAHAAGFATARRCSRFLVVFLYGYGYLSGGKMYGRETLHACYFDYYPDRSSPILVNFGSRGVTARRHYSRDEVYRSRSGSDSRNWVPWLGGHSELGAAPSRNEAVL